MTDFPSRPLRAEILAPPCLWASDGSEVDLAPGKPMALLVFIALHPEGVERDTLTRIFWPESSTKRARASLRQALFVLRSALGSDLLQGRDVLSLTEGQVSTDLDDVESALDQGDALGAAEMWTTPPMDGFPALGSAPLDGWMDELRERFERRLVSSLIYEGQERLSDGAASDALARARHATRIAPWSETAMRLEFDSLMALRDLDTAERLAAAWSNHEVAEELLSRVRAFRAQASVQADGELSAPRAPFLGRESEFGLLSSRWSRCQGGSRATVVITGDPGIGKSRLASEVLCLARSEGARVASIKGAENSGGVDMGGMGDLSRQLLAMEGGAGISLASHRTLTTVIPSAINSASDSDKTAMPQLQSTEAGYADAFLDLVAAVAEEGPLVLLLDDFDRCDPRSQRILARAICRAVSLPLMTMVTSRIPETDRDAPRPGTADLEPSSNEMSMEVLLPHAEWIALEPWSVEEVGRLIYARIPTGDPEDIQTIAGRLHHVSRGNPYFTLELVGILQKRNVIEKVGDDRWAVHMDRLPLPSALPARLEEILDESLLSLTPDAARLAGHLSLVERPADPGALGRKAGMSERRVSRALASLFDRGIVRWKDEGDLVFSHDEVRAAAARHFRALAGVDMDRRRRRVTTLAWGIASGVACILVLGAQVFLAADVDVTLTPPFGGGEIVISTNQGFHRIIPDPGPANEWVSEPFNPGFGPAGGVRGPFLTPEGDPQWFRRESTPTGKPWISRISDQGAEMVFRSEGDDYLEDVSADGGLALIRSQPIQPDGSYRLDLLIHPLDGGTSSRIYEPAGMVGISRFSPSGNRIALIVRSSPDTLALLRPSGEVVYRLPIPGLESLAWCGDEYIVAVVDSDDPGRLLEIHSATGSKRTLPVAGYASPLAACSPDGSRLLYASAIQGRMALVLQDRDSGQQELLGGPAEPANSLRWLPPKPGVRPVAARVDVSREIEWGATADARLMIENTGGEISKAEDGVTWFSSDPDVAVVTPEGVIVANGRGSARIEAVWDGWLEAGATVEVSGSAPSGGVFYDDFGTLDRERWWVMGTPPPRGVTRDGESVLLLDGDALHYDGLVEAESRAYPRGVTVEVAVQIPFTRRDKQWFSLCLLETDSPSEPDEGFEFVDLHPRQTACLRYPNGSHAAFDPSRGNLSVAGGPNLRLDLSDHLPSDDWVQIALEVRSDGVVSVFANQDYIGSAPLYLRDMQSTRWRLMLVGSSWETEVLVKNLRVWEGPRY